MANWLMESKMLYKQVIEDVVQNCKELFLDEGIPEDILMDLKAAWEHSVESSNVTNFTAAGTRGAGRTSAAGRVSQLDGSDSGDEEEIFVTGGVEDDPVGGVSVGEGLDKDINMSEEITSEDDEPEVELTEAMFETENILVCQYDKITRVKNKYKINLKLGIMTVNDKDYVFNKCTGEAEW
ncbi:hypothetical protein RvY_15848 [Ramazzottius varieornatus]|uniref:Uncharacterized protein n=1 Tax=Ramazzottius varieornatus TaxID=947166 RepID=A0A1D1W0W7_RAMVA|nr:hypothetical protein RvY_15848 [Ramazzottius varieornatus]